MYKRQDWDGAPLDAVEAQARPKRPLWKRITAGLSLLGAVGLAISSLGNSSLSELVTAEGLGAGAPGMLGRYAGMLALLVLFAALTYRKAPERKHALTKPPKKHLSKRTLWTAVAVFLLIPATLLLGFQAVSYTHLDVYKRQVQYLRTNCPKIMIMLSGGASPCKISLNP